MARRPHVLARFHSIADLLDRAVAQGCTADEAGERAIEQVQQLRGELRPFFREAQVKPRGYPLRRQVLPLGSWEIESGHRHVL